MAKIKKAKPTAKAKKAQLRATTAFHAKTDHGDAIVGIGNLRVMITVEDSFWFAQGLEIDYAAQGSSLEDVQARFESGLAATINEHLRVYGDIEHLLVPAPREAWRELLSSVNCLKIIHTQLSIHPEIHRLPFSRLDYIELATAA